MGINKCREVMPSIKLGNSSYEVAINDIPHILVVGKPENRNKYIKTLINQLVSNHTPLELLISFLGMRDTNFFEAQDDPHLFNADSIDGKLATKLVEELEKRYSLIWKSGFNNCATFNLSQKEKGDAIIPTMVVVFNLDDDSFKDDNLFYCLITLLQKGRAAGIHVIVLIPSLSKNKCPMLIKANTPMVISFEKEKNNGIIIDYKGKTKKMSFNE